MSDSATIVRDGEDTHRLQITHRDWMLLWGPGFADGAAFSTAFGIFENYTVAGGIPNGSQVERDGNTLHAATRALLISIERDLELLRYDYSYKIADEPKQYGGGQGIGVAGRTGILSLRPKGYCSIEILDGSARPPKVAELIDLRAMKTFVTDSGTLKVFRRKAVTHWLDILPPLLTFLSSRRNRVLILEHIDRVA